MREAFNLSGAFADQSKLYSWRQTSCEACFPHERGKEPVFPLLENIGRAHSPLKMSSGCQGGPVDYLMCLNKLHSNRLSGGIQSPEMLIPKVSSLADFGSMVLFNICS